MEKYVLEIPTVNLHYLRMKMLLTHLHTNDTIRIEKVLPIDG